MYENPDEPWVLGPLVNIVKLVHHILNLYLVKVVVNFNNKLLVRQ